MSFNYDLSCELMLTLNLSDPGTAGDFTRIYISPDSILTLMATTTQNTMSKIFMFVDYEIKKINKLYKDVHEQKNLTKIKNKTVS